MTWAIILLAGGGFVALALAVHFAPEGWEDRDGFHVGREPQQNAGCDRSNSDRFAPVPFHHALPNTGACAARSSGKTNSFSHGGPA